MRTSTRYSIISRICAAVAGLWLCGAGTAWAGGGADFGSLTALLTDGTTGICHLFNIVPCPTPPSVTQAALEVAALGNNLSEMLLNEQGFPLEIRVKADNPAATAAAIPFVNINGQNIATLPTASTTPSLLSVLSTLTPLAFQSQNPGTAQTPGTALATQVADTTADTFFYAVGLSSKQKFGSFAPLPIPDTVYFFYDDLLRTNQNFSNGSVVAKFSFVLKVLTASSSGFTERAVPTTLNFVATNAGDCSMSTVVGDFAGTGGAPQQLLPEQIGMSCGVVFSASPATAHLSPATAQQHAIFEVGVPLLVTGTTDPLYFYTSTHGKPVLSNPVNSSYRTQGVDTAFEDDDSVFSPPPPLPGSSPILGTGVAIGLAPSAAPLCSDLPGGCPIPGTPTPATFSLCANLPNNKNGIANNTNGNNGTPNNTNVPGAQLRPAVGAYYAIATSGETLLSAALGTASSSTCSLF